MIVFITVLRLELCCARQKRTAWSPAGRSESWSESQCRTAIAPKSPGVSNVSTFRASLPPHTTEKLSTLLPVSDSLCDRDDLIRTNLLVQYCTSTTRHCGVKEVVNTVHATGPDLPRENQVFARLKTRNHNLGTSTVITDRVVHLSL